MNTSTKPLVHAVTAAFLAAGANAQLNTLVAMTMETAALQVAQGKNFEFVAYMDMVAATGLMERKSVANMLTVVKKLQGHKKAVIDQYTFDKEGVLLVAKYIREACTNGEYRLTLDDMGAWATGALSFKAKAAAAAAAKVAGEIEAARIRAAKEKEKAGYVVDAAAPSAADVPATVPEAAPMVINAALSQAPAAPDGAVPDTTVAEFPLPTIEAHELDHEVVHMTAPRAEQGETMVQETSDAASEEARILRMVREASVLSDAGLDLLVNSLMEIMDARLQAGKELLAA